MKIFALFISLFFLKGMLAQNVGIGWAAPTSKLYVRGGGNFSNTSALNITNQAGISSLFVRNDNKVGMGTLFPGLYYSSARLELADDSGNNSDFVMRVGNSMGAPIISWSDIVFQRSDGTLANPSLVTFPATPIGRLNAMGYDGTTYHPAARITLAIDGNTGLNDMPGAIWFETAADGTTFPVERMRVANNGYVGIGTTAPFAPLHVVGSANITSANYAFYALGTCNNQGCSDVSADVSILASNRIRASEFNAFSDARIKNVVSLSTPYLDMERLNKLQVTNFTYKDIATKGNQLKKGFIAQQVESVFPEAVSHSQDFIPNIYQMAKNPQYNSLQHELSFILPQNGLEKGDVIRMITTTETVEKTVVAVKDSLVVVSDWRQDEEEIFVYGKLVNDFRSVDYDRIFTLNVAATQALIQQVKTLQTELNDLKKKITKLEAEKTEDTKPKPLLSNPFGK